MSVRDPWFDPSTEPVRRLHLAPLVEWIRAHWRDGRSPRVLDYGCGDLLLAAMLGPDFVVDGFDIDPAARRAAARRVAGGQGASVLDDRDMIPPGAYDGVVLSSVVQYLGGPVELEELLGRLSGALAPAARGVLVTDVVVTGAGRVHDAVDLFREVTSAFGPVAAVRQVLGSARRSPGRLWAPEPAELVAACRSAGLVCHRLPANLSSFRRRATYLLHPPGSPPPPAVAT